MAKFFLNLMLLIWLLFADCRNHDKQHKHASQLQQDRSLENYLKNALESLKLDSIETNNHNTNRKVRTDNQENGKEAEKHYTNAETSRIQSKRAEVTGRKYNKPALQNSVDTVTKSRYGMVPKYKSINVEHRPTISPKPTSIIRTITKTREHKTKQPPKINIHTWRKLKRIIQQEFNRDYGKLRKSREKFAGKLDKKETYNEGNSEANGDDDNGDDKWRKRPSILKPHNQGTRVWSQNSSFSMTDWKNWLVFGIGVGCTVMLFMVCILGYHCVRYIKYKDGLFAKTDKQTHITNPPRCRNNNNLTEKGDYLTRQHTEEQGWSSEEEVFNVSIPRSFNGSLPNSPSTSKHSTPIKNRKALLK